MQLTDAQREERRQRARRLVDEGKIGGARPGAGRPPKIPAGTPRPEELIGALERSLERPGLKPKDTEAERLRAELEAAKWLEFLPRERGEVHTVLVDCEKRAHGHGWLRRMPRRVVVEDLEPADLKGYRDCEIVEALLMLRALPLGDLHERIDVVLDRPKRRVLATIRRLLEDRGDETALAELDEIQR